MPVDVDAPVKMLNRMTVTQLRVQYSEIFGEATRSFNKRLLVKHLLLRQPWFDELVCHCS